MPRSNTPQPSPREAAQEQADGDAQLATGLLMLLNEDPPPPALANKQIRMGTLARLLIARHIPATSHTVARLLDDIGAGRTRAAYISGKKIRKTHVREALETLANPPEPKPVRPAIKPLSLRRPAPPEPAGNGNGNGAYSHRRG